MVAGSEGYPLPISSSIDASISRTDLSLLTLAMIDAAPTTVWFLSARCSAMTSMPVPQPSFTRRANRPGLTSGASRMALSAESFSTTLEKLLTMISFMVMS